MKEDTNPELFGTLYDEVKLIAQSHMRNQLRGHTLQPTALVSEAYLKLMEGKNVSYWQDRKHFLATVATVMRQVLVDHARAKSSKKRGGEFDRVELRESDSLSPSTDHNVLAVHEALFKLEAISPVKAQLTLLRYFAGLTVAEAADVLSISPSTAKNHWSYSRAWLQRELTSNG